MPIVTNENAPLATEELEAYVARVKEGWRAHAASLSWEEKIAAIERMRARSASLREGSSFKLRNCKRWLNAAHYAMRHPLLKISDFSAFS